MIVIHESAFLIDFICKQREKSLSIGFVPTMGALHRGHTDLIDLCAKATDVAVCSIFVNPTQFNDPADYKKYPDRLENDIRLLAATDTDLLFIPKAEAIYPDGTSGLEQYDLGYLDTILEGKFRPGHFTGVSQVMMRLLRIVRPDLLFMGQKDYQQCMVVNKLLSYLDFPVSLITCPTVREPDGLAMSSRNLRLSPEERSRATLIFEVLTAIRDNIQAGNINALEDEAKQTLANGGFRVEYVEIADATTLLPVDDWNGSTKLIALVAAFIGDVRLIDNMLLAR